jgi:hypothetical protein
VEQQQQKVLAVAVAEGMAAGGRAVALAAAGRGLRQGTVRVLLRQWLLRLQQQLLGSRLMMRLLLLRGITWGGLRGLRCLLMWRSWATTLRQILGKRLQSGNAVSLSSLMSSSSRMRLQCSSRVRQQHSRGRMQQRRQQQQWKIL